jgi:hypothetical protein
LPFFLAGNEALDALAKQAAQGAQSALVSYVAAFDHPLPVSKAAAIEAAGKSFQARWKAEWSTSPCIHRLSLFDAASPSNLNARMYDGLSHPQCSILTRLWTGHIGLNAHLHRFRLTASPDCSLCFVPETVSHFLLACPAHHHARRILITRLGTARLTLRLLSSKADHKPVLDFVRDTDRFPRYAL